MKKTKMNRLVAFVLAFVMVISMFVGCSNQQGREDLKNALESKQNQKNEGGNTTNPNAGNSSENDFSAQIVEIQNQINNLNTELNVIKAEKEALEGENAALRNDNEVLETENITLKNEKAEIQNENTNLKTEITSLQKLVEELKSKSAHEIVVRNNVIWVHIEDFLYAANGVGALISAEDGTGYALRTLKGVHVKVYDDEHGDEHLVPKFDLPMYDYYTIVLTADEGKSAFTASFGNYNWANRGLMTTFTGCKFVKELSSMPKNGGSGKRFYNLIKATAVVASENGTYRFAIDADNYGANPVIKPTCNHGNNCHCGDCDKCPALKPETIIKTETIEKIVEVEKVVVVPGETIYISGQDIHWNWCGRCGYLMEYCICRTETPDHNTRPGKDETTTPPGEDATQNPEGNGTVVETPNHNTRPGEGGTTTNPEEDSTQNSEGNGTVVETPAHSERPGKSETSKVTEDSTGKAEGNNTAAQTPSHGPRP